MKVAVTLNRVQAEYLDDLVALQLHGSTREEVAYSLMLEGLRKAFSDKLIMIRHQQRK